MDETVSLTIKQKYECPVCGYQASETDEGLSVSFGEYAGTYCINCYAKWIHENIPKMEKMEEKE